MSGSPVICRTVTVRNRNGLHLRPWVSAVKLAQPYKSKIEIVKEFVRVDMRSVISLMTLGVRQGESFVVEAVGEDAEAAVAAVADFLNEYVEPEESTE
jgi:phosphotransferase system HPr (HPr) family protein